MLIKRQWRSLQKQLVLVVLGSKASKGNKSTRRGQEKGKNVPLEPSNYVRCARQLLLKRNGVSSMSTSHP